MQPNDKITIDLYDFFRSGKFDYLRIGQSRDWILANFPDPDDWSSERKRPGMMHARIWRYGNLELHFVEDKLSMIFSDYIDDLDGGNGLTLDKWLLAEPARLTLRFVMEEFLRLGWAFSVEPMDALDATVLQLKASGVKLWFNVDAEGESVWERRLGAFVLEQDHLAKP